MRSSRVVAVSLVVLAVGVAVLASRVGPSIVAPPGKSEARRIVPNSPALAECLFAIGAGDRVVGVSNFCNFPPEAARLPRIGGFLDPNLLAIEALAPDLILVQGSPQTNAKIESFAAERGIATERFSIEMIGDVLAAMRRLGEITGAREGAAREVARLEAALDAVRKTAREPRPKVVVSISRTPGELREIATTGKRSFIIECLEVAGGETLFPDFEKGYRQLSKEAVAERRPDVVIELRGEPLTDDVAKALVRDWEQALPDVPAVKNERVHVLWDEQAPLIPGPRLDKVVTRLAALIR